MKYTIRPTSRFQKDLKRVAKRGYNTELLSDVIKKLARGEATGEDVALMKKIGEIMERSSLCGLGETAQAALLSAMQIFPDTFAVGGTY